MRYEDFKAADVDDATRRKILRQLRDTQVEAFDPAFPQSVNIPAATYAPWLADAEFQRVYDAVRRNTLVDVYRCHELWVLATRLARTSGDVLEVGTWRGGTGCLMAAACALTAPEKRVFLCDTFAGVVKAGEKDTLYKGGEHSDASSDHVVALTDQLNLTNVEILRGIFPDDTAGEVADRRFALCHIDVDVYASARAVFEWVSPRLSRHGVVVFDDYGFRGCEGVTRLVNELAVTSDWFTSFNLNGHAVMLKLAT